MVMITAGMFKAGLFCFLWQISTGLVFEDNKIYTYSYEVKQQTGIADDKVSQFAVRTYNATLVIKKTSDKAIFQLTNLKTEAFNVRKNNFRIQPNFDSAENLGNWNSFLQQPFAVEYDHDGMITSIEVPSDESGGLPNTQKAIASLFQVDLRPFREEKQTAYSATEDGIGGDCNTIYQVNQQPNDNDGAVVEDVTVTKIRLYDECKHHPSLFYTSLKGYPCPSCKQKKKPLIQLGKVEYQIKNENAHFIINKIESTGKITFVPFGTNGQKVSSLVRQSMTLLNVESKAESPPAMSNWKRYSTLSYTFLKTVQENERLDMSKSNFANWIHQTPHRNRLGNAKSYLSRAASDMDSADGLTNVMRLKEILQSFSYTEFNNFFADTSNFNIPINEVARKRRNVLINVLPLIGTYPSFHFMLNLINLGTVRTNEAEDMLSSLPLYIKESSVQILEVFWEFLHANRGKELQIFNSGWLSFGSLVYKSCVINEFNPRLSSGEAYINEQTCNRCLEKMILEFRNAKTEPERMTLLRAIKNTRYPASLPFFFEILRGKYSIYLRHTALCGISLQINMHKREEISNMVRPVFFNYAEDDILRIYAFELLLYLYPTPEFFSELVANLVDDPSQQVASHIYSTLLSFANSTDPCHEKFTDYAKLALNQLPEPNYDILTHSFNRHFTYYNAKYQFGRSEQISLLGSNSTVFPREIYFRQGFNLLDYNFDLVEYGLTNSNPFYLDLLILSLRQNLALMPGPPKHPNALKALRYKETKKPDNYEFELYGKIFNQDVLLSNSLEELKNLVVSGSSTVKDDMVKDYTNTELRSYEATYVVPNEMGVPTILSLELPVQIGVNGTAKFNIHKPSTSVEGKISLTFVSRAKMSVALTGFSEDGFLLKSSGRLQIPIHGSVSYKKDDHKHKLQLKYTPPKQTSYPLLQYDTKPLTFLSSINRETPTERKDAQVEKSYQFGHDYLGYGVRLNLRHEDNWNENILKTFFHKSERYKDYIYLSEKLFSGVNGLLDYAILNPTTRAAHVEVNLEQSQNAPTKEVSAAIQTSYKSYSVENNNRGLDVTEVALKIEAKGPKKREWIIGYHIDHYWPVKDERNFQFYFKRSSIPNFDKDEFEVCLTSNMSISNYSDIFNEFLSIQPIPVKLRYDASFVFGKSCTKSSEQLRIKVLGEKSEKLWMLPRAAMPFYADCEENIASGFAFSFPCWLAKKHAGRLDKFIVDVRHNNLAANVKDKVFQMYSWFRHIFYNNLQELSLQKGLKHDNQVQLVANFSLTEPLVDVIVIRPDQRAAYKDIYIPNIFPQYQPFTVAENVVERFTRNAFNYKPPFCIVSGNNVRTFDGVVYKYSVNQCYHVVFSECRKGEIAVLYRQLEGDYEYKKAIKLLLSSHTVEMIPESNDSIAITVDGQRIFTDGSKIHTVTDRDGTLLMHVIHDVDGYVVEADEYDFEFFFNGNDLEFFVSSFYKGKHCGLCGNYDGEKTGEFLGPDGKLHQTLESFTQSYAAKGRENYCN